MKRRSISSAIVVAFLMAYGASAYAQTPLGSEWSYSPISLMAPFDQAACFSGFSPLTNWTPAMMFGSSLAPLSESANVGQPSRTA